ncbi:hypothetical protein H9X81_11050 [Hydrogenoanaerobacterium saccharovorans]|uniref:Restriction endonuclease n=1 Tax=Hydrogenoanaerobacterium saccharovorans TaxID=474960 RepID=A0ABS2GRU0_9FIRM|nr:hypothetical protein [Hydrogenoanaerobacterium saccharovorans]MBM6924223.1 hypothetical protein [Hydrogenoanaerobacterium saccharovorans]
MVNDSERLLDAFSELYFYKELVQSNLHFTLEGSTEKEVADLLINVGDFIIAIQLKARNEKEQTFDEQQELKWLTSKCRKAKKQIKDSIQFIQSGQLPAFKNGRGKFVSLISNAEIVPLIVFMNETIGNDYPHILKKHSEEGMDVNCLSFRDFQNMCRALLTPMEIIYYLQWRLMFYQKYGNTGTSVFIDDNNNSSFANHTHGEALVYQFIAERYGTETNETMKQCVADFSFILHNLPDRVIVESEQDSSYPLILFFAHFERMEIKEYVDRVFNTIAAAKKGTYNIIGSLRNEGQHYVVVFVSTHDGYFLDMEFLEEVVRKKCNFDILLQVYCYWENEEDFRIDYCFRDYADRYLK